MKESDVKREIGRIEEALERMADNARELGLDYEPKEEINNASYIAETYHEIDYDKVNTVEDIKLILNALGVKFISNHSKFNTIEPFLKK
jgi:hypothetical protein